jgi:hypothetical protein
MNLPPSITNYHNDGLVTFNRNAESQRTFVQINREIVIPMAGFATVVGPLAEKPFRA